MIQTIVEGEEELGAGLLHGRKLLHQIQCRMQIGTRKVKDGACKKNPRCMPPLLLLLLCLCIDYAPQVL